LYDATTENFSKHAFSAHNIRYLGVPSSQRTHGGYSREIRSARDRSGRLGTARDRSGWLGTARDGSGWLGILGTARDAPLAWGGGGPAGRGGAGGPFIQRGRTHKTQFL
jgi:hypothetical protein